MPEAFVQALDIYKEITGPAAGTIPTLSNRHGTRRMSGPEENNGNA
jgi:hypothetical protein